jgi:hypothetical protein
MNSNIKITALNHNTIEVSLPESIGNAFPTIPSELHGRTIPQFVLSWLLETDEVGYMIQETLQAPTRSMCRVYGINFPEKGKNDLKRPKDKISNPGRKDKIHPKLKEPLKPILKSPAKGIKKDGLKGHSDSVELDGLPKGIRLPKVLENNPNVPDRVKVWIEQGKEVQKWLIAEGLDDATWLPA